MTDDKIDDKISEKDIDFGSLDNDLDQDINKFDLPLNDQKIEQRKPVTDFTLATARGVLLPSEESLKTIENEITKRMPETGKVLSDIGSAVSDIDMYKTQFMTEITPALNGLKSVGRRLFDKVEKYVPSGIKSKIGSFLQTPEQAHRESIEDSRNDYIQQQIANLAQIQTKALERREISEEVTNFINQQIETYRHKDTTTLLAHITQATKGAYAFLQTTLKTYIVKSLSLKYKSMFYLQDLVSLTRNILSILDTKLEEIKHNSALPDIIKSTKSEELKYYIHQKLYGNLTGKLSDFSKNFTQNLLTNIKTNVFDKLKEKIIESAENIQTSAEMASGMAEDMDEYGMSKAGLAGEFTGGFVQRKLLSKLFNYLEKKHIDINKINNIDDLVKKLYTTTIFGAGTWLKDSDNEVLNWIGENIIPAVSRERGEIENVLTNNLAEPVSFDVMTRKAIVEIIPSYLSMIHSEVAGINKFIGAKPTEKVVYDVKTETFTNEKAIKDRIERSLLGTEQSRIEKFKPLVKYITKQYLDRDGNADYLYQHLDDIIKFAVNIAKHAEPIRFSVIKKLKEGEELSGSELVSSKYMFKDIKNPDALIDILYTSFTKQPDEIEEIIKASDKLYDELPENTPFTEKLKHRLSQIKEGLHEKYESTKRTFGDVGSIAEFNQIAQSVALELDEQLTDTLNEIKRLGQQSLLSDYLHTKSPQEVEAYRQKLIQKYQEENIKKLKKKYKSKENISDYLLDKAKELTSQQKSELDAKVTKFANKTGLSHDVIREKLRNFNKEDLIKDIKELSSIQRKSTKEPQYTQTKSIPHYEHKTTQSPIQKFSTIDQIKSILKETLYPIKSSIFAMKDSLVSLVSKSTKEQENIESGKGGTGLIKDEPQISGPGFYIQKAKKELHLPLESKEDKEAFLTSLMLSLNKIKSDKQSKLTDESKLVSTIEAIKKSLSDKTSNTLENHETLKQLEEALRQKDYQSAKELLKTYATSTKESVKEKIQSGIDKSPILTKLVKFLSTPAKWIKDIWGFEYNILKSVFGIPLSLGKSLFGKIKGWFTNKKQIEPFGLPENISRYIESFKSDKSKKVSQLPEHVNQANQSNIPQLQETQQLAETTAKANIEQTDFLSQIITYLQSINESISTTGLGTVERLDQILLALQSNLPEETKKRLFKLPKIQPKGLFQKLKNIAMTPFTYVKEKILSSIKTIRETGSNFSSQAQKYLIDLPKSIIMKPFSLFQSGIKGLGNLSSKGYKKIKDVISNITSKITKHKETILDTATSIFKHIVTTPFNTIGKIFSFGQNKINATIKKFDRYRYPDIYIKDKVVPGYPKVPGEWIKTNRAILANGKSIKDISKIDQPVIDSTTGQTLITVEDLKDGLVDIYNRPLVKLTDLIKTNIDKLSIPSTLTSIARGTFSVGTKVIKSAFGFGSKILTTGTSVISTIFNKIAEKLHLPKLPTFVSDVSKKIDTIISLLQPVSEYFKIKLPETKEGSYQDYLKDRQKENKLENTEKEIGYLKRIAQRLKSPFATTAKTSIISRVANLFRSKDAKKETPEKDNDSFFGDLLEFELGRRAIDYIKKSRIGSKAIEWGSKTLKLPFKILGKSGSLIKTGLKTTGKIGIGIAGFGLSMLSKALPILFNPYVAIPLLVAGTGYVGYRLWKSHNKRNKVKNTINPLLIKYYGTKNLDAINKLSKLSYQKLINNNSFTKEEFQSIATEFGFDPDDEQQMRYFATWYQNRFSPIFLKIASIMKSQFGKDWDEYIDLDPKTELPLFTHMLHKHVTEMLTPQISKLQPNIKSYLQFIGKKVELHTKPNKPNKPNKPLKTSTIQKHIKPIAQKSLFSRLKDTISNIGTGKKDMVDKTFSSLISPFDRIKRFFHKEPSIQLSTKNVKPSRSKETIKHIAQSYYPYIQSAIAHVKDITNIDIPPELVIGVIAQESAGNPNAISPVNATGLMQILPMTAQYISKRIGVPSTQILTDPKYNILAGTYYLATLYKQFRDWPKSLAAYNWGPANVKKYKLSKAPIETQKYITGVLGNTQLAKPIINTHPLTTSFQHITNTVKNLLPSIESEAYAAEPIQLVPVYPNKPITIHSNLHSKPEIVKPNENIPNIHSGEIKHIIHTPTDSKLVSILQETNNVSTKQLEVLIDINANIQKFTKSIEKLNQPSSEQKDNITQMLNEFNKNISKLTETISKMDASKYFTNSNITSDQSKFSNTLVHQFSNRHIDFTKKRVINQ